MVAEVDGERLNRDETTAMTANLLVAGRLTNAVGRNHVPRAQYPAVERVELRGGRTPQAVGHPCVGVVSVLSSSRYASTMRYRCSGDLGGG